MYEGWPEEASVTHFLGKPKRPTRIAVAAIAFLAAGVLNLVVGGMQKVAGEAGPGNFLLKPFDKMTATPGLIVGGVTLVWLGIMAFFVFKGTPWSLKPARWTALAGVVACGLFGSLALPGVTTAVKSEGLLGFYSGLSLLDTAAYAIAGIALLGASARDFFRRPEDRPQAPQVPQQVRPQDASLPSMEPPRYDPPPFEPPQFKNLNDR